MTGSVTFENGTYGRRAVLHGDWSVELAVYLAREGIVELELNQGKGWAGMDLSFLARLPDLMSFEIFDFNIKNIAPIHYLRGLRHLGVTTYCSTPIDFSKFAHLEDCGLEWRPKATSLFECTTLKRLFVNRYKGKDTDAFSKLRGLESLTILNAPIRNLNGLRSLSLLTRLRLGGLRRLASLAGIEDLANLEELDINTCRAVSSIEEVGSLLRLRKFYLNNDGDIASLKPLNKLIGLEDVFFAQSTNIVDGDLSPIMGLKHLCRVGFQNRRHYSHRCQDFGVA
jgi:Leucine-rich repeat (LRR) protein